MRKRIGGLILAAGLSSRMGDFKPLMPLRGKTLIENSIDSMLLCGIEPIVVVLGHRGQDMEAILKSRYLGDTLKLVYNYDYATTDMLTSVKIGLSAMPACDAFFLLPGDMPVVAKETFLAVYRAMPEFGSAITFPTLEGYRKHPPLIDAAFIPEILSFAGENGLRGFWKLHEDAIVTVAVDDIGCWTDLDTFAQYSRCIQRYQGKETK
ncbi:MAG: nucleotidyltransferase family protein [Clostridia bacterium]|nr:nucleotidyltransferase family protein [Clostridia bacterium]